MTDYHKTVELGSITMTCMLHDSGEKSCEIVDDSSNREGVRLTEEDLHNIRSTAEETWDELEKAYGDNQ